MITADYVNAVFKVLNHLDGDVTRSLVAGGTITAQDYAILRAIYNDPLYQEEVKIAQQSLQQNLSNVRKPPGDRTTTVVQLIDSTPTCIFVQTRSTYDAVLIHPTPPAPSEFWMLKPKQNDRDPIQVDATPWAFSFNITYLTPRSVPDECNASS